MRGLSRAGLYIVISVVVIAIAAGFIAWMQLARQPITTPTPTTAVTTPQATAAITSPTTTPSGIKYNIIIATGGVGGVYYYYGATIAGIISNYTDIIATSVQTAASIDNLILIRDRTDLSKGVTYYAAVLPDSAYLAYTGQHERFRNATAPISILWAMYPNHLHIVTTADKGIKTVYDLKGKRASTGAPGSGTEVEALLLLKLVGIDPAKDFAKWERLGAEEIARALQDGSIDAYFWSGGLPTGSIWSSQEPLARGGRSYI